MTAAALREGRRRLRSAALGLALPGLLLTATTGPLLAGEPKVSRHEPYQLKQCLSCHVGEDGLILKQWDDGPCASRCHEDMLTRARKLHGPLNLGDCSACHQHHESDFPRLLRIAPEKLCARCHAVLDRLSARAHGQPPYGRACLDCHDPHSSDDRFFVREQPTSPGAAR